MSNTYTLTYKTVANLKEGDILSQKNEVNFWEVCGISPDAPLYLREVVSGEEQYLFPKDFYGWTVTTAGAETSEPPTPTPSVDARLIAMAILVAVNIHTGGMDDEDAEDTAAATLQQILKNL